jgi:hypothetical protein
MMEKQKPFSGQVCQRFIDAQIRAKGDDSRTVELSFSSELPVERWYGSEILSHDDGSMDIKRLMDVGVVLFSHGRDANYGKMPIGRIEKAWLDPNEKKGRAEITFDDDEDSEKVFQKVKKGFIKGISVGYTVSSWEEVMPGKPSSNGRFMGPAYIALRWEPYEISVEPTPADPAVGVGRTKEESQENPPTEGTRSVSDISILKRKIKMKTKF